MKGPPAIHRRPRIALYSHDTVGLGHIRRNQLIAKALVAAPFAANVLLITGVRQGGAFPVPDGVDSVIMPAYRKAPDGSYRARSLEMELCELTELRSALIDAALRRFKPDLFIVDNVPAGACGELLPTLRRLRDVDGVRCVLGLRDILDDPAAIRREWGLRGNFATIRDCYDEVWVYGDKAVFPTADAYAFPNDVRAITRYLGYLDPRVGSLPAGEDVKGNSDGPILCSVGGGEDGFQLAQQFAAADYHGTRGLLVTGPLMAADRRSEIEAMAKGRDDFDVIDAVTDPMPMIRQAKAVIGMAGYNSVNEVLALGKPHLLVPRTAPRREQWIRASRMAELGLADLLVQEDANAASISAWIAALGSRPHGEKIGFVGLGNLVERAAKLIGIDIDQTPDATETVAACA